MVDCCASSKGIVYYVDDLLTTKQLRDLLQVDRITIYRMLYDGRLHGFKVGGQWRFSRQEIEAWLQYNVSTPTQIKAQLYPARSQSPRLFRVRLHDPHRAPLFRGLVQLSGIEPHA